MKKKWSVDQKRQTFRAAQSFTKDVDKYVDNDDISYRNADYRTGAVPEAHGKFQEWFRGISYCLIIYSEHKAVHPTMRPLFYPENSFLALPGKVERGRKKKANKDRNLKDTKEIVIELGSYTPVTLTGDAASSR
ncbi:hypothetical protein OUZ56_001807 [Daphnia magna]|uniref:Uncharacterized protein n=1 Tax=Daphnia magna TaxID=35525 RepID=A0ABR0A3T8_9CRUS|nr:hypothetical protein OUZ56_001807 [Daphnia magna]